jgi:hypothetical protein
MSAPEERTLSDCTPEHCTDETGVMPLFPAGVAIEGPGAVVPAKCSMSTQDYVGLIGRLGNVLLAFAVE